MHTHTERANMSNSLWLRWGQEYESASYRCDQTLMPQVYSLRVFVSRTPQEADKEHLQVNVQTSMCVHVVCQSLR